MSIGMNTIPGPGTLRKPGAYSEIDNSQAVRGPQSVTYRRLLMGQKLAAGSATVEQLVLVTSAAQADTLFGKGSMLAGMVRAALAIDSYTELQCMPMADNGAGVAATGTIVCAGSATASGTINLLIAGRSVDVGVVSGDASTATATAIAAAINANLDLPVTASAATSTVTITARQKGECGNTLDVRVNYYVGQALPAGVTATIAPMTGGTGNPDIANALAAIGQEWFHTWAFPYVDSSNLTKLKTELTSRFAWDREIEAHAFGAARGTQGTLATLGASHNSPNLTLVMANDEPMPAYEKAAETMAIAAYYASIDPARPLQYLAYNWCLPPASAKRFTNQERNLLMFSGIAATKVDAGGVMQVERLITTYRTNMAGAPDVSYLDSETMFTLMFIRHDWRDYILRKYPRHKLASDGTRYGIGQPVVTPVVMRAEALVKFREWEDLGLVENMEAFKASLIAERNVSDVNRLDVLLPPDLVNQLRIIANKIQFRL